MCSGSVAGIGVAEAIPVGKIGLLEPQPFEHDILDRVARAAPLNIQDHLGLGRDNGGGGHIGRHWPIIEKASSGVEVEFPGLIQEIQAALQKVAGAAGPERGLLLVGRIAKLILRHKNVICDVHGGYRDDVGKPYPPSARPDHHLRIGQIPLLRCQVAGLVGQLPTTVGRGAAYQVRAAGRWENRVKLKVGVTGQARALPVLVERVEIKVWLNGSPQDRALVGGPIRNHLASDEPGASRQPGCLVNDVVAVEAGITLVKGNRLRHVVVPGSDVHDDVVRHGGRDRSYGLPGGVERGKRQCLRSWACIIAGWVHVKDLSARRKGSRPQQNPGKEDDEV